MSKDVAIRMIGDWNSEIGAKLSDALYVSMNILGKEGIEVCKQALIHMAKSARKMTKASPKKRPIKKGLVDGKEKEYVEIYRQGKPEPSRIYKFQFGKRYKKQNPDKAMKCEWADVRVIGNSGLAQRSWFWGLSSYGLTSEGKGPIRGMSRVMKLTKGAVGYIKENKLPYIQKAMPSGWEQSVQRSAANKMMAVARTKLLPAWRKAMENPKGQPTNAELSAWWRGRRAIEGAA